MSEQIKLEAHMETEARYASKAISVITSCKTIAQHKVASRYASMVITGKLTDHSIWISRINKTLRIKFLNLLRK